MHLFRLSILCCLVLVSGALAKKPEDVLGGKIMLSETPFPRQVKSPDAFLAQVKKQAKDRFWENKETRQWKLYYAAFFKKPVDDLEIGVKFYDISDGSKRLVQSFEQYLDSRGQRAIIGNVVLKKGEGGYDPNSKILVEMDDRGRLLAQAVFYLQGEGRKFSGKVEFTEEETHEPTAEQKALRTDEKPAPKSEKPEKK